MITSTGWTEYSIWEHSEQVRDLYRRRCRLEAEEMTCAAQAAELLQQHVTRGETLLDAGCGSGYFYHSLKSRDIPVEYYGVDGSKSLIGIGRECLPAHGLDPSRLMVMRLEDMSGSVDHVLCMNVLSNIDNFHRPLERFFQMARKTVILRESVGETSDYRYVVDQYLDKAELRVHVNRYACADIIELADDHDFDVEFVTDERTGGNPEDVIGYPHYWTFAVFSRAGERPNVRQPVS